MSVFLSCLSVCRSVYIMSLCLSLCVCLPVALSLSLSLCLSFCMYNVYVSVSVCQSVALSLCVCLSLCLYNVSVCLCVSVFLSVALSLSPCPCLSVSLCLSFSFSLSVCVCLLVWHFVTVTLNGEVKALKCGDKQHWGVFEKKENGSTSTAEWGQEKGRTHTDEGRGEMKRGKKKKTPTTLWGTSVCCEHGATAWKHRHCRSLHQPPFHRPDSHLNCNLICNAIILAHIPSYVTLRAKSCPRSK